MCEEAGIVHLDMLALQPTGTIRTSKSELQPQFVSLCIANPQTNT